MRLNRWGYADPASVKSGLKKDGGKGKKKGAAKSKQGGGKGGSNGNGGKAKSGKAGGQAARRLAAFSSGGSINSSGGSINGSGSGSRKLQARHDAWWTSTPYMQVGVLWQFSAAAPRLGLSISLPPCCCPAHIVLQLAPWQAEIARSKPGGGAAAELHNVVLLRIGGLRSMCTAMSGRTPSPG